MAHPPQAPAGITKNWTYAADSIRAVGVRNKDTILSPGVHVFQTKASGPNAGRFYRIEVFPDGSDKFLGFTDGKEANKRSYIPIRWREGNYRKVTKCEDDPSATRLRIAQLQSLGFATARELIDVREMVQEMHTRMFPNSLSSKTDASPPPPAVDTAALF